jgi:uncharacterized membrane protein YdjX (TVP38/TMEM64 family)
VSNQNSISFSSVVKFIVFLLVIAASIAIFKTLDLGQYFTQDKITQSIENIREFESRFGIFGPVLFWVFGTLAIIFNIPSIFIIWFAVMTYGILGGAIVSGLCINTASPCIFWISRLLGRDFIYRVFGSRFSKLEDRFEEAGLMTVLYFRLVFFMAPHINWFLGLMKLSFRDFVLGTFLGTLHNIIINAWVGSVAIKLIIEGRSIWFWNSPEMVPPVLIGTVIFLGVVLFDKRSQRMKSEKNNDPG